MLGVSPGEILAGKSMVPLTLVNSSLNVQYATIAFVNRALFPHHLCNVYLIPKLAPFLVN